MHINPKPETRNQVRQDLEKKLQRIQQLRTAGTSFCLSLSSLIHQRPLSLSLSLSLFTHTTIAYNPPPPSETLQIENRERERRERRETGNREKREIKDLVREREREPHARARVYKHTHTHTHTHATVRYAFPLPRMCTMWWVQWTRLNPFNLNPQIRSPHLLSASCRWHHFGLGLDFSLVKASCRGPFLGFRLWALGFGLWARYCGPPLTFMSWVWMFAAPAPHAHAFVDFFLRPERMTN